MTINDIETTLCDGSAPSAANGVPASYGAYILDWNYNDYGESYVGHAA